ncbi:hypothetical protein ACFQZ4_22720 [Catellatospora coxensis]|uniref:Uncharacterized protein n=1 Tax=Catellatospora coxensis TaxID=310354 RepID=A0A8J3PAS0_9ACTN|nr:hypothetical protein [Catellatospora coxensis]GIG09874.1 hypothetical protein Cco03nite_65740 [Catellatospora coxensis]
MTEPIPTRPSWLGETLTLLRTCWWRVLAISVGTGAVDLLAVGGLLLFATSTPSPGLGVDEPVFIAAVYVLPTVLSGACTAWAWAAAVEVLRGAGEGRRVRVGAALGLGVRRAGPLTLWLVGIGLVHVAGSVYVLYRSMDYPYSISSFQTLSTVVTVGGWYLTFATALLPLVVLFERRGPGRAWLLAHSRAATIGQIVAMLAFGFAVDRLATLVLAQAFQAEVSHALPWSLQLTMNSIIGVLVSAVTMTALTAAYLHRVALSATPGAPSADPVPGGSEPAVIELGRTW